MGSKILLVTGKKAEELVRKNATRTKAETDVEVLSISIASFMNLESFLRKLKEKKLEEYKIILVPGLAEFDLEKAEKKLKTPVFKGPKHAADLPLILENIEEIELSKTKPASELLEFEVSSGAEKLLAEIKEKKEKDLEKSGNFKIGGGEKSVLAGPDFPPVIVAEITDAPRFSMDEILETASRYVDEGAEILDIGMVAEKELPGEIPGLISLLRDNFDVPLSIDTTNKKEIETAVEEGIDLVVSIDGSTIHDFEGIDIPTVLIPRDPEEDYYPSVLEEKIDYLNHLLELSNELGYKKPIVDPILEPVGGGFTESLTAFRRLRKDNPEIPLFMGIGNVVELYDADSIGMTALLLGAASEMNIDFVLSVEASDKTLGNISEIATARDMMILSEHRGTVPKDLGIDLLRLKEKRKFSDPYEEEIEKDAKIIQASGEGEFPRDKKGFFRIFVKDNEIVAVFHSFKGSDIVIKGKTAAEVGEEIVERDLVSELSHAAYLGRELQKAETAVRTGRGYVQEEDVF